MGWERVRRGYGLILLWAVLLASSAAPAGTATVGAATAISCGQLVHQLAGWFSGKRTVREVHYSDGTSAQEIFRLFGLSHQVRIRQPNGIEVTYNRTNRTLDQLSSELLYPSSLLAVAKGAHMLDVGCGGGNVVEAQRRRGVDAVGSDIVLSSWQRKRDHYVEAQAHRLPFKDGEFDVVYSTWSFLAYEGSRQDPAGQRAVVDFLSELGRVTKPGGVIRLSPVPYEKFNDESDQVQVRFPELDAAIQQLPGLKVNRAPTTDWLMQQWYTPTVDPRDRGLLFDASVWIELIRGE
jgi:ubiquinone/menaquinone biosynthesis C-methylase UbiE